MSTISFRSEAFARGARMLRTAMGPAIAQYLEDPSVLMALQFRRYGKAQTAERRAQFDEEGAHFDSRYFLTFLWLPPAEDAATCATTAMLSTAPEGAAVRTCGTCATASHRRSVVRAWRARSRKARHSP